MQMQKLNAKEELHTMFMKAGKELMGDNFVGDIPEIVSLVCATMKEWKCSSCYSFGLQFTPVILEETEGFHFVCGCGSEAFVSAIELVKSALGYPKKKESIDGSPIYSEKIQKEISQRIEQETKGLMDSEKFEKIQEIIASYQPEKKYVFEATEKAEGKSSIEITDGNGKSLPPGYEFSPGDKIGIKLCSQSQEENTVTGEELKKVDIEEAIKADSIRRKWETRKFQHQLEFVEILTTELVEKELIIQDMAKDNGRLIAKITELSINKPSEGFGDIVQQQNKIVIEKTQELEKLQKEIDICHQHLHMIKNALGINVAQEITTELCSFIKQRFPKGIFPELKKPVIDKGETGG